jgi:hypothetical protein
MELVMQSVRVIVSRDFEVVFLISLLGLLISCAMLPALNVNDMLALMLAG